MVNTPQHTNKSCALIIWKSFWMLWLPFPSFDIFLLITSFVHCRWSKNLKNLLVAQYQHCVGVATNIAYMWEM